jgi:hypothetical protein
MNARAFVVFADQISTRIDDGTKGSFESALSRSISEAVAIGKPRGEIKREMAKEQEELNEQDSQGEKAIKQGTLESQEGRTEGRMETEIEDGIKRKMDAGTKIGKRRWTSRGGVSRKARAHEEDSGLIQCGCKQQSGYASCVFCTALCVRIFSPFFLLPALLASFSLENPVFFAISGAAKPIAPN